jgi:thiol:disulfide interchange protein DsbG
MKFKFSALVMSACMVLGVSSMPAGGRAAETPSGDDPPKLSPGVMRRLERATWVRDVHTKQSKHAVYVFTDPECSYCNRLWKNIEASHANGAEVRYLLVGVITPESRPKAAAILQASNPSDALAKNEKDFTHGGVAPASSITDASRETLSLNASLMEALGIPATPGIVYEDAKGDAHVFYGVPTADELQQILKPK